MALIGSFLMEVNFLSQMNTFSINLNHHLEVLRAKEKFSDNPSQNILELYIVLVLVRFTTSKMKLDI